VLKIQPYAVATVSQNKDKSLNNNSAFGNLLEVHPNPYNVSVSITPKGRTLRNFGVPNDTLRYTVTAKNIGKRPAEGTFSFEVAAGLEIVDENLNVIPGNKISWIISQQLQRGESLIQTVLVRPTLPTSSGLQKNTVSITPEFQSATPDADLTNNTDVDDLNISVVPFDFRVSISPKKDTTLRNVEGETHMYTITVTNHGERRADVKVSYQVQPDSLVSIVRDNSVVDATVTDGGVEWTDVIPLEVGGSRTFTVTVEPKNPLALGQVKNIARVDLVSSYFTEFVTDTANLTLIEVPYNLSVIISPDEKDLRNVGGEATQKYTITAINGSERPANVIVSYKVKDLVIDGSTISDDDGEAEIVGDSIAWPPISLMSTGNEGAERTFTVTVAPQNASSRGRMKSVAYVKLKSGHFSGQTEDSAIAYLNLFPALDSWAIMEAFSPNGDGKNDWFAIPDLKSIEIVDRAEIVILNRYGSEVYYNSHYEDAQNESKAFTGAGLPEGSYFYQLTVHFTDGSVSKRGGVITLRRSRWK
jgi:gliding motility-associated-like protein